jgi:nucleotide-binding universal stress UspA family protein
MTVDIRTDHPAGRGSAMNGPVVVGFDDSEHSVKAIDVAVRESLMRRVPLHVVHARHSVLIYPSGAPVPTGMPMDSTLEDAERKAAASVLGDVADRLRSAHPGLTVETSLVTGYAPDVLAEAGRDASLLVVGGRGRGGFTGMLLGSVTLRVLPRAQCPVMVVHGDPPPETRRVLVGVDFDAVRPASISDLLEFAFAEATLRGAEVRAVHVWDDPTLYYWTGVPYQYEHIRAIAEARRVALEAVLAPWREKNPDVVVSADLITGSPSRVLADSTRIADVVVLGARARTSGHGGMRIGALAHSVLHHAQCPVILVPEDEDLAA